MNIRKIICPTDFSDPAYEALLAAADLAGYYSAELLVAHAVECVPPLLGGGSDPVAQFQARCRQMEEEARGKLEQLIRKGLPAGINVRTLIKTGPPAVQILEWAEEYQADLIVIATHGLTGFRHALLGSVSERIIRQTTRPVWIIHTKSAAPAAAGKPLGKLKRILCPTDFSASAEAALQAAAGLAGDYSAELLVVNVVEPLPFVPGSDPHPVSRIEEFEKEMTAEAEKKLTALISGEIPAAVRVRPLVESGQPAVHIVDLAEKNGADLIVIATHGLSGWRQAFLGSVTERVIRLSSKPMLIIQTKPPVRTNKGG